MTQLSLFNQPQEGMFGDGIRYVFVNGVPYFSVYDICERYTNRSLPNLARDIPKFFNRLKKQGFDVVSNVIEHQFYRSDGKINRATPVATYATFLRIAQVADFKEWEHIRQHMADLAEAEATGKPLLPKPPTPVRQSREYRHLIDSGMTDQQAINWIARRDDQKELTNKTKAIRSMNGAKTAQDFARLENEDSRVAIGKTSSQLKKEMRLDKGQTPRDFLSYLENGLINVVKMLAGGVHKAEGATNTDELIEQIDRFEPAAKALRGELEKLDGWQRPVLPDSKPQQKPLLGDGK